MRRLFGRPSLMTALIAMLMFPAVRVAGQGGATKAPRSRNVAGQLMLSGQWNGTGGGGEAGFSIEGGRLEEETKIMGIHSVAKTVVIDPPDGKLPFQPWALAERNRRWEMSNHTIRISHDLDSQSKCFPNGVPHVMYRSGILITQFPDYVLMQFEWDHQYRVIYTDGRPHLPKHIKLWYGDSRGRWEGDTLVVDVTNINGYSWLSVIGDWITDDAHIVERLTPVDEKTMKYTATITDLNVYTRPWTMQLDYARPAADAEADNNPFAVTNGEIWENTCREGNRNLLWRQLSPQNFAPEWRLKRP